MISAQTIMAQAKPIARTLTAIRRDLHRHPELGLQETRTARKITETLRRLRLEVKTGIGGTGVTGLLRGKRPGKTVALRADMDALPIQENNSAPYRSLNPGVMHACGHDGHTAMVLGAAMILKPLQDQFAGNVKFIFQPAEETVNGAEGMIQDGVLKAPAVDAIFGIHFWPELPSGVASIQPGPIMAAAGRFKITITGKGGHGAKPDLAIDPLMAGHHLFQALQTIRRTVSPFEPCVLSICAFNGGTAFNIIPETVEMQGTLRTYRAAIEREVQRKMRAMTRGIAAGFGVTCDLQFLPGAPATINDKHMARMAAAAARDLHIPLSTTAASMGSEDFSFFLKHVPGAYLKLGTQKGKNRELHHPRFDFDEAILPRGAALLAACAVRYLDQ